MKPAKRALLFVAFLATLVYTAYYVYDKERIISRGTLALFELAPVDPRSLLQGDYMSLRYAIGADIELEELPARGYIIFTLDEGGVATFKRLQRELEPLAEGEHPIAFWRRRAGAVRNGAIKLGSESYFFQEGEGEKFSGARYGGMRIDDDGKAVLVGLWDQDLKRID